MSILNKLDNFCNKGDRGTILAIIFYPLILILFVSIIIGLIIYDQADRKNYVPTSHHYHYLIYEEN